MNTEIEIPLEISFPYFAFTRSSTITDVSITSLYFHLNSLPFQNHKLDYYHHVFRKQPEDINRPNANMWDLLILNMSH